MGPALVITCWTLGLRIIASGFFTVPTMSAGLLRQGDNVLGVIVGNGWYGMPKLLLQLEVTYARWHSGRVLHAWGGCDGRIWSVTSGPIVSDSIYDGEVYDARLEKPGWDLPGGRLPEASGQDGGLWIGSGPSSRASRRPAGLTNDQPHQDHGYVAPQEDQRAETRRLRLRHWPESGRMGGASGKRRAG